MNLLYQCFKLLQNTNIITNYLPFGSLRLLLQPQTAKQADVVVRNGPCNRTKKTALASLPLGLPLESTDSIILWR